MSEASYFGHYRLERVLGSGSFATVWLARDERLEAPVAVKVLADNWSRNADIRHRFIEEARVLRRIDDDRVVRVHAVDEMPDGRPYIVMSWADRGSLAERIAWPSNRRGMPAASAAGIVLAAADCLSVVHAYGVVHRDVKPSNVLFRSAPPHQRRTANDEALLLADFGLAKDTVASSGFTLAAGTPAYMAPEQAETSTGVDLRADLYSLTAILFELLTGTPAFSANTLGRARAGQRTQRPQLARLRPDLPGEWQQIVDRGLSEDPQQRYSSARELASAIRSLVRDGETTLIGGLPSGGPRLPGPGPGGPPALPVREPDPPASPVAVVDVVAALVAQARSSLPHLSDGWSRATAALRRPVRVALSQSLTSVPGLPPAVATLGDLEIVVPSWGVWPGGDIMLMAGGDEWAAPPSGRSSVPVSGPVRLIMIGDRSAPTADQPAASEVRNLEPFQRWPADPQVWEGMVAWLGDDIDRWIGAVRAHEAAQIVDSTLSEEGSGPVVEDLVGRLELIRLAHPVLGDLAALRAETAGTVGLARPDRAELRRILVAGSLTEKMGVQSGEPEQLRAAAAARAGYWRGLVNRGLVPYSSRWAADAVARAFDRVAVDA